MSALGDQGLTVDETIDAMPEPWKSRARKRIEKLREDLREALAEMSVGEMNGCFKSGRIRRTRESCARRPEDHT